MNPRKGEFPARPSRLTRAVNLLQHRVHRTNERLVAVEPLASNQVRRPGARHGARCRAGEPQRAQLYAWWCLQWVPLQLSRLAREASYVLAQELVYRI
jgi:hypothetical protein